MLFSYRDEVLIDDANEKAMMARGGDSRNRRD